MTELIIGIDDAGRGPIIGPMILAGILIEKADEQELKEWGAKDSKQLTPEKREEIAEKIFKKHKHHIELTSPEEIDSRTKVGTNLNRIEAIKAANIINVLLKEINEPVKIIVDCPSPNREAWGNCLKQYIEKAHLAEFFIEHKADVNHISVSAASVIAKVTRDAEVEKIKKEIGINFGSGYCSDPLTKIFLEKHLQQFENSGIIRKSWDTWTNAKAKKEQKKLF